MGGLYSTPRKTSQKVLIAVDGSKYSQDAFDWYMNNLNTKDDQVLLFHAGSMPQQVMAPTISIPPNDKDVEKSNEIMRRKVAALREDFLDQCSKREAKCSFELSASACPGPAIVQCSKDSNCDLVVMGTRGQGTLRRTVLGSVSDYLISHSDKPVIVVPPR